MYIKHFGHSSFVMKAADGTTIITDPYDDTVGAPKITGFVADAVTVSHEHYDHNATGVLEGNPRIIKGVVSTDVGSFHIDAKNCFHDDKGGKLRGTCTMYKFTVDRLTICHMADLGENFNEDVVNFAKGCDVLMIPVGGTYTIDAETAVRYCEAISAKIVIPMHYFVDGLTVNVAPPDRFLAGMGGYRRIKELEVDADNIKMRSGVVLLES